MDKNLCSERPTSYIKGPDVMGKSEHTRSRYAKSFKDQTRLDLFLQSQQPAGSILQARKVSDRSISSSSDLESEDCIEIILMTSSYHKKKKFHKNANLP